MSRKYKIPLLFAVLIWITLVALFTGTIYARYFELPLFQTSMALAVDDSVQHSITGRVTDEGQPLSRVVLTANNALSTTTQASGTYTFTGLISGTYTIRPLLTGYSFLPATRTVELPPDVSGQDFVAVRDARSIFLPLMAHSIDLSVTRLEITQAIQDQDNSTPLVANRPTIVRVYAQVRGIDVADGVILSLSASKNGQNLGSLTEGPLSVTTSSSPGDYDSTFNFSLPQEWRSGDVTLTAEIDPGHQILESDEVNNRIETVIDYHPVPALDMKLIPINYTHLPNGTVFPAPTSDTVSSWIIHLFPLHAVDISMRAPFNFEGDLSRSSEWNRLLQVMVALKQADGSADGQVYYGVLPRTNATGDTYPRAFGGYAAIGWVRAGAGMEESETLTAHEVGHNFGLRHAPCGDPAGPDPNYPYPDASIGQFGLDVFEERLWSPREPDNAKDLMSYCGPRWISDYNYFKLYQDQLAQASAAESQPAPGLLVRISLDDEDIPAILPVYSLVTNRTQLPEQSVYRLELIASNGDLLASYPVPIFDAEESGVTFRGISVVLPKSSRPPTELRLLLNGNLIGRFELGPYRQAATFEVVPDGEQIHLRWDQAGTPAMIRYTDDNGASWVTVGLDSTSGAISLDRKDLPEGAINFEVLLGR